MIQNQQYINKADLLWELWSHTDEFDNYIELIYEAIRKDATKRTRKYIIPQRLYSKEGQTNVNLFGKDVTLDYKVY